MVKWPRYVLWLCRTALPLVLLISAVGDTNRCSSNRVSSLEWLYRGHPQDVCPAIVSSAGTPTSRPSPSHSSPSHLLDYIFLVECSQTANLTYLDYFSNALQSLATSMRELTYYDSVDATFTVILYSVEQAATLLIVSQSITKFNDLDLKEMARSLLMVDHIVASNTVHYSSREMSYMAVDTALQILSAVLEGDELTDVKGKFHIISLRPHANVHVVVGLGLYKSIRNNNQTFSSVSITRQRDNIQKSVESILDHTHANTALHFFVAPAIHPAIEFIGSPRHEVRYRDCTHLNKALTLKALLGVGSEANSLQAHILALGRNIHVMELSALTRADCVRAISPFMWSGFDTNTKCMNHIDKCGNRRSGEDNRCGSDTDYCFPVHGCVAQLRGTPSGLSSLSDDRVPLTGQPVMSHADLAKSVDSGKSYTAQDKYTAEKLSITRAPRPSAPAFSLESIIVGKPHTLKVTHNTEFTRKLIKKGRPVVVKNSIVSTWAAMEKWDFSYLQNNMGMDILPHVKCTNDSLTFDPDRTAPLKVGIPLPFTERNLSTSSFFSCIQQPSECSDGLSGHYYFGSVPETLKPDLGSTRLLFHTDRDYESGKQFMWISSAGMITHGHFDQDFNFFAQLIGRKRFTLWPSSQHELMYMYPRVHPLWHKSRINFRAPDLTSFPNFAKSRAVQVVLEPGDVLYVPPYTWHYVETLSPSVSLSTWSHDYHLYSHMNAIYRHDHKFDLIQDPRGQMFALRLYLDMMIHDLYGFNQTTNFFIRLLGNRFTSLQHLFPPSPEDPHICSAAVENKIPTCIHVHGYVKLDMAVVGMHFQALQPEVMDILFANYVEEIAAQVVGVRKMLAFFRYCFLGQEYYVTELGDEEHALWDHKDLTDESSLF